MLVENVQGKAGYQCIPHGILLIKETRIGSRLHIKPAAPFIDHHADLFLRIIAVHDIAMLFDQLFHLLCLG